MPESALIDARNVDVTFPIKAERLISSGNQTLRAVSNIDLKIEPCESVGLVGESGSGKTTLGNALLGLQSISNGEIQFAGKTITNLSRKSLLPYRQRMQIIFQDPYSSLHPRSTVEQIIEEPLVIHKRGDKKSRRALVAELLEAVGLSERFKTRYPNELSGGQRQRVGIARALALDPEFIVADEAVSALDVSVQAQILNLLKKLQREKNLTLLFISHDLAVVEYLCDRVAVMYLGEIVEMADTKTLYSNTAHPYTAALLSATLDWQEKPEERLERIVLEGDMPSRTGEIEGCPFRSRCWFYQSMNRPRQCAKEKPQRRQLSKDHWSSCHFSTRLQETEAQLKKARPQNRNSVA